MPTLEQRPTMWLHDCGCIEMADPHRVYPCAEHTPVQRDYGLAAVYISLLVIWAGFIYLVVSWAR